jgi:hypothetical protein
MNTKTTQLSAIKFAIENLTNAPADVMEKLESIRNSLETKANAVRKPTPKQKENAGFKQDILAWMQPATLYSVTDVEKGVPSFAEAQDMSHARVTAMLSQLVKDGSLIREEVKGKAYFKLA